MQPIQLETLYARYGISHETLTPLEAKRLLLEKLLERNARLRGGTDRTFALTFLKLMRGGSMPDSSIDSLLEPLVYDASPSAFDPPRRPRSRWDKLILHGQIARGMRLEKSGVSAAAKSIFPSWKRLYKNYKNMASRYHQVDRELADHDEWRIETFNARLIALLMHYSGDEVAMSTWASFCRRSNQYKLALLKGEFRIARYTLKSIDDLFDKLIDAGNPFAISLALCCSDMPLSQLVEKHLTPLLESFQCANERQEIFAACGAPPLSEREAADKVLRLFENHAYLPDTAGQRKIRKAVIKSPRPTP
jgi:hypothetical protein